MQHLLDSTSRLINFKNRNGLRIVEGDVVPVFTAQSKLKRFLKEKLDSHASSIEAIKHPINRSEIISKIILNAKNLDKIYSVYDFWNTTTPTKFVEAALGSARAFFTAASAENIPAYNKKDKASLADIARVMATAQMQAI